MARGGVGSSPRDVVGGADVDAVVVVAIVAEPPVVGTKRDKTLDSCLAVSPLSRLPRLL